MSSCFGIGCSRDGSWPNEWAKSSVATVLPASSAIMIPIPPILDAFTRNLIILLESHEKICLIHPLSERRTPKFKRWTTLLERMPKMSTSYCLWLCSCSCLFQTLIFLNFKKQLWMQSLPSKLGGVGVPFFGGNAVFSPVFKKGGKVLGESWQSHPHLASILEFEWSTWKWF